MLRDLLWPFCGWRPFRMHRLCVGRVLTVIGEVVCRNCGRRWLVHKYEPGMWAWSDRTEAFFQALSEAGSQRSFTSRGRKDD